MPEWLEPREILTGLLHECVGVPSNQEASRRIACKLCQSALALPNYRMTMPECNGSRKHFAEVPQLYCWSVDEASKHITGLPHECARVT
ncbi:hypothetical protein AMTR_s00021p00219980 [Amborella trichopoda]|uniref:Uncharacterized protein n=1 Tax=Amborella trichopoda TaxID=13333 RepID=W1Q0R2_AMBTC|nr:hypothetical protein AMTR_s00021p00219980 [Amborella trichopoda]